MEPGNGPGGEMNPGPDGRERHGFSNLIEHIPLGVFRLDLLPGYPLSYANRNLALMLGYTSASEIIGTSARVFLLPSADITPLKEQLFSEDSVTNVEVPLIRKDGSAVPVMLTAKLQYAVDKSLAHIEGFVEDITERQILEMEMQYHDAELNRYALALSQANKKLNLLQSITRHDILNQLTALSAYLELMKESIQDPQLRTYISTGEKVTETISTQIRFTKDYQDIGVESPQWFDIGETLKRATASIPLDNVTLKIDIHGLMIYADPLLEKVFFNLVTNALRHAEGLTWIRFTTRRDGDAMVIVCQDDGNGVAAEHKEAIFRREYFKNTGFGLFLSREILGITGLSIQETGQPGKGARFEITVPRDFYRISS
jgi:PAS domain S-box-containing protein